MKNFLTLLCFSFVCLRGANAYCFESDFPIVYVDPFSQVTNIAQNDKFEKRASYFGYSTVMYPGGGNLQSWIQIGAPRAYSEKLNLTEPGMIVRCRIFGPCERIDVDPIVVSIDDPRQIQSPDGKESYFEDRNKAWIGVSMDINFNHNITMVCGHKWLNTKNHENILYADGVCYWNNVHTNVYNKLLPLLKEEKSRNEEKNGGGLAGMSAQFSNNKEREMILGAPGLHETIGSVIKLTDYIDRPNVLSRRRRRQSKNDIPFGEINIPTNQGRTDEYLGYAVTSGFFFGQSKLVYAASLPRENYQGSVIAFRIRNVTHQPTDILDVRRGTQMGEYFGAAITSADVNGDGFDDLIVGSPHYLVNQYDEGRVQIFYGSPKSSFSVSSTNSLIEGNAPGGEFGLSVASLGDVDRDGYADVAVGAPYEDQGSGVVYIFMGSRQGLRTKPSQRLVGKEADPKMLGFGISIAKTADVDANYYNDLTIGAYQSGHTVLYRSKKPVVLKQSVEPYLEFGKISHDQTDFKAQICIWFECQYPPNSINVTRIIGVDEVLERGAMVEQELERNVTIQANLLTCMNITIKMKTPAGAEEVNFYDPFIISVSQNLIVDKPAKKVITVLETSNQEREDEFNANWPVYNAHQSLKNQVTKVPFTLGCNHSDICVSHLQLDATFVNTKDGSQYVVGSQQYLQLRTTVTNLGENAYLTEIYVQPPKRVYFKNLNSTCENFEGGIKCHLANPLRQNIAKYLNFDLDMAEINGEKYESDVLDFNVTILTSSNNTNVNSFTFPLQLVLEADIELTGTSGQEYYYMNISRDSANFTEIFSMQKHGHSPLKKVLLEIDIPVYLNSFGDRIKFLEVHDQNCVLKKIEEKSEENDAEIMFAEVKEYGENNEMNSNRTFFLNCTNPKVECCSLNFTLGPFKGRQPVHKVDLKMLFKAFSLADLLGSKDVIKISTFARATIVDPQNFTQSGHRADEVFVSSVFTSDTNKSIAPWIIILAILTGVALLALATFGLIKAGFFKRTQKMELEALKKVDAAEYDDTATVDTLDAVTFDTVDENTPIQSMGTFKRSH